MDDVSYRFVVREDIPRLVELFNAQYARKKNGSYFVWQYFESIWPTIMVCAVVDGNIEGVFGLQRKELSSGIPVAQAIDLLITPRFRGKGIFAELARRAAAHFPGLSALCVFPNNNGKTACEKKLGWKVLGKIDSLELESQQRFDGGERIVLSDGRMMRQESFLYNASINAWRFDRNPEYRYQYIRTGTIDYAITKIFADPVSGKRYGDIVYFSCDRDRNEAVDKVFRAAGGSLFKQDIQSVTTWALPHSHVFNVLTTLGFRLKPQERYFCVHVINRACEHLYELQNWHLVQSDAEIY